MTDGDKGITIFFAVLGLWMIYIDGLVFGILCLIIAALMIGMSMGKEMSDKEK